MYGGEKSASAKRAGSATRNVTSHSLFLTPANIANALHWGTRGRGFKSRRPDQMGLSALARPHVRKEVATQAHNCAGRDPLAQQPERLDRQHVAVAALPADVVRATHDGGGHSLVW